MKPEGVGAVDPRRQAEVLHALRAHLPADCLLSHAEDTRPYECDGLTMFQQQPMLVALPRTEEQVVELLRVCRRMQVPVVPRGAGTSLSGGALPHAQGVLLSQSQAYRRELFRARFHGTRSPCQAPNFSGTRP